MDSIGILFWLSHWSQGPQPSLLSSGLSNSSFCSEHFYCKSFHLELYAFGLIGPKASRQGAIIVAFKTMRIVKLNRKESKANQPRWLLNHFTSKECLRSNGVDPNKLDLTRKNSKSKIGDTPNQPFHAGDLTKWSPHIRDDKSASKGAESPTLHLLLVKTKQLRRVIPFDDLKRDRHLTVYKEETRFLQSD